MANPQAPKRGNLLLGLVLGAVVGLMVLGLAWTLLRPTLEATPAPATTSPTPSVTPTPTATRTPTHTPTPTPSDSPSATPSPTVNANVVTDLPAGSWITVLKSLPQSQVSADEAVAMAAQYGNDSHRAVVIDTNAFPNLNAGYYAIVIPGQSSRAESNAVCAAIGIAVGDDCYPREIKG